MEISGIKLTGIIIFTIILTAVATASIIIWYMKREIKKLQKAMQDQKGIDGLIKDPKLRKQLEELKKRFGGF